MYDYEVYANQLASLGYGYPLWEPSPVDYSKIRVADVGYIRQGSFHRLFNAAPLNPDDNKYGVPANFVPLELGNPPIWRSRQPRRPGAVHSRSIREKGADISASAAAITTLEAGATLRFESSSDQGAILITKHKTFSEDVLRLGNVRKYIRQHHMDWLEFANGREERDVRLEDLMIVTGFDVTLDFAMAAFANSEAQLGIEFRAGVPSAGAGSLSGWGRWSTTSSVYQNSGPQYDVQPSSSAPETITATPHTPRPAEESNQPHDEYNQCVFLRRFRVRKRAGWFPKVIKAAAGPHDLGSGHRFDEDETPPTRESDSQDPDDAHSDDGSYSIVVSDGPPYDRVIDPLDPLFDYIFENSDAQLAIIHDDYLDYLMQLSPSGNPDETTRSLLLRVAPEVFVDHDGIATLEILGQSITTLPHPSFQQIGDDMRPAKSPLSDTADTAGPSGQSRTRSSYPSQALSSTEEVHNPNATSSRRNADNFDFLEDIPNSPPSYNESITWLIQPLSGSEPPSYFKSFFPAVLRSYASFWIGRGHYASNSLIRIIEECREQSKEGNTVDWRSFDTVLDALKNLDGLDDRKLLLEMIVAFLSHLSSAYNSASTRAEHFLVDFLYADFPRRPSTFLGPLIPSKSPTNHPDLLGFSFREADGSNNNPLIPGLGAAHTPYVRLVTSSHVAPLWTLPDPAIVFDTLLRRDKEVEHPTGLSSLFFACANLITHTLFRTNTHDWSVNDTSSYPDLSPLYGVDQREQAGVRRYDGTGRMWNDVFADSRLLAMPPSAAALLVVFNRNHNYIANRILSINERGTFQSNPFPSDKTKLKAQDDEIFNRAKLVNCGTFMRLIIRDYVGCILRMIPDLNPWHLNPLEVVRGSKRQFAPRGEGNVRSVESNLLYHWSATTSHEDEKWFQAFWKNQFPDKSYDEVTPQEFYLRARMPGLNEDVKSWTFAGLKRDERDGRFDDGALANIIQNATSEAAGAFKARGTPAVFKVIEMMTIQQARNWGVCTLNEFRSFLGLKPYSSFEEWNPNPEIYTIAEQLYHDIDNLELYVGIQAEETKPTIPGSGLCAGYTMSRSILADAVNLIRADRFLTTEYTPLNLTSWGFCDAATDDNNGSLGGVLPKLLFRTLPRHYPAGSIYAHFPLMAPRRMREFITEDNDMEKEYNWSRPHPSSVTHAVDSFEAVKKVVTDWTQFGSLYAVPAEVLTNGYGFFLGSNDSTKHRQDRAMIQQSLFSPTTLSDDAQFYYMKTVELIEDRAFAPLGGSTKTVDIVRQVLNFVPVHWAATRVAGLPLQTKENPEGIFTEQKLYGYLAVLFDYVYLNAETVNDWCLKQKSRTAATMLLKDIKCQVERRSSFPFRGFPARSEGDHDGESQMFLRRLYDMNRDRDPTELAYIILGVIVNSVANWAHAMAHIVNFYLSDQRKTDKDDIVALVWRPINEESERLLIGYAKEALRLDPPASSSVAGVFREVRTSVDVQGAHLNGKERVVVNLAKAIVDESHIGPDASVVNPNRHHAKSQLAFVVGAHTSVDEAFSNKTMAHVLRAVFSKKNLRRVEGASGQLTRFTEDPYGIRQTLYIDSNGQVTRWPQSLLVQFDI